MSKFPFTMKQNALGWVGLSSADNDGVEEASRGGSPMLLDAFETSGEGVHSNKDNNAKDKDDNHNYDDRKDKFN